MLFGVAGWFSPDSIEDIPVTVEFCSHWHFRDLQKMPEPVQSSWADEIEDNDSTVLPPPSEKIKGDIKTVTEYSFNEVRGENCQDLSPSNSVWQGDEWLSW
jgi:hypothetical protein